MRGWGLLSSRFSANNNLERTPNKMKDDVDVEGNDVKSKEEPRLKAGFEFGADMNETFIFAPQIYIVMGCVSLLLIYIIILWACAGFWWPLIFFWLAAIPLFLAPFVEILSIKYHLAAQTLFWIAMSLYLLIHFCVNVGSEEKVKTFGWADRCEAVKAKTLICYGFIWMRNAYTWSFVFDWLAQLFIWPIIFFLVRMTWHGFFAG